MIPKAPAPRACYGPAVCVQQPCSNPSEYPEMLGKPLRRQYLYAVAHRPAHIDVLPELVEFRHDVLSAFKQNPSIGYAEPMPKSLLTDELWAVVEPLLPKERPKPKGGRLRVGDRATLTANRSYSRQAYLGDAP